MTASATPSTSPAKNPSPYARLTGGPSSPNDATLLPYDPAWATRPGWQGYADVEPFPDVIEPWAPELARIMFLSRFAVLAPQALRAAA